MNRNRTDKTPPPLYAMPDEWAEIARTKPIRRHDSENAVLGTIIGIAAASALLGLFAVLWGIV